MRSATQLRLAAQIDYGRGLACLDPQEESTMKLTRSLGMLLLGIWLILTGLLQVVSIPIPAIGSLLALLAIAAGVLILLGR
jgi:hypothetical protein